MTVPTTRERPVSTRLRQLLAESFSAAELRDLAAIFDARDHVPEPLARELAEELAAIVSSPAIDAGEISFPNRPTLGWWRRRAQRIEQARST